MNSVIQISGKYAIDEDGLFNLKNRLQNAGLTVNFPENEEFIGQVNGIPVTFLPNEKRSFYEVELEFFDSIKLCNAHIVHNKYKNIIGYIGESASLEIAYAIIHNKPIVFLHDIKFSEKVPDSIKEVILSQNDKFFYAPLHIMETQTITNFFNNLPSSVSYMVKFSEELTVMQFIIHMISSYKNS